MAEDNPLWMPAGSVRGIIALVVILGAVVGGLISLFRGLEIIPEKLWELALIVAAFYFGMRSNAGKIERIPEEEIKELIKEEVEELCVGE